MKKVLFVDDERPVLDACRRALRKHIAIDTAQGGAAALEALATQGPYAVIVSDMRMPEMNGVQLLAEVRKRNPHTVRMMLTGNSDQQTAIDAVNEGDIFRFLNKPCPPDKLLHSVEAALEQNRLITAEKQLLEDTLQGAIKVLADVLALVNPEAFGRTTRLRKHVRATAEALGLDDLWQFESMALLSQIGCVTVPDAVLRKQACGEELDESEAAAFARHPAIAGELLDAIPRLDAVADAVRHQRTRYDAGAATIPIGGRILHAVMDYEQLEGEGTLPAVSLERLRQREGSYDPGVLDALEAVLGAESSLEAVELDVSRLTVGMTLAQDVTTGQGALVLCKGQETSESVLARLTNFARNGTIGQKVVVWMDAARQPAPAAAPRQRAPLP